MHTFFTATFTTITFMPHYILQKLSSRCVTNKRVYLDLVEIFMEFNAFMLQLELFIQKRQKVYKNRRFPLSGKNTENKGLSVIRIGNPTENRSQVERIRFKNKCPTNINFDNKKFLSIMPFLNFDKMPFLFKLKWWKILLLIRVLVVFRIVLGSIGMSCPKALSNFATSQRALRLNIVLYIIRPVI